MGEKPTSLQHRKILAQQQHLAVREFLNQEPSYSNLLEGVVQDTEQVLLKMLLGKSSFVDARDVVQYTSVSSTTSISEAAKRLNVYLDDFSRKCDALRTKHTVIKIPREKGGGHFGYYLACFNTKTGEYLDSAATEVLFDNVWKDEIKSRLLKKLEEEAHFYLSEKLKSRNDYQPLDMEIGTVEEKSRQDGTTTEFEQASAYDHNRVWKSFDSESLLEPKGLYILSSDCGAGKTTYLRALQLEILQKPNFIPIFLNAREIEKWGLEPNGISEFAVKLTNKLDLKLDKAKVTAFLEDAFKRRNTVLLVDGLDQIRGGAAEYEPLARKIIETIKANVIIASRPSAVVALEGQDDVSFLRLKPFSRSIQKRYFGEQHYKRARGLSVNCPDSIAIPMLAYMVRTLIEKGEDKDVKNRAGLYKKFIKHVLTEYRHGELQLPLGLRNEIRVNLQKIAYYGLNTKEKYIQRIPLEYYNKKLLQQKLTMKADELTKSGLVNLIVESGDCLYFTHQSFQEYLAAEWTKENTEAIEHILDRMWNPKWKETMKFLAGMLGEDFIRKIYSPGCRDNCIHSRLFLAAECCGEIGEPCELEKAVFNNLRELAFQTPFGEDTLVSLSHLNSPEAIDFLANMAMGVNRPPPAPIRIREKPLPLIDRIVPMAQNKFLPRHIDSFISMLEAKKRACRDIAYILGKLAESLTAEQMNRIVELECSYRTGGPYDSVVNWYHLAGKISSSQVDRIFELVNSENKNIKRRGLLVIEQLTRTHSYDSARQKRIKFNGKFEFDAILPVDVSVPLLPRHIEALLNCAGTCCPDVDLEVCWILARLAGIGVLSSHHIDSLIRILKTNNAVCRHMITKQAKVFADRLSSSHLDYIINFMGDTNLSVQFDAGTFLGQLADRLSTKQVAKIVSWLDSDSGVSELSALEILEKVKCRLSPEQLDKIIDLLLSKEEWIVESAISALSPFVDDMTPKQVDRILSALNRIDFDFKCTWFLEQDSNGVHFDDSYCPVPKELTEDQIEQICCLLRRPCHFIQKLGVGLLVNMGDALPKKHLKEIIDLLSYGDPYIVEMALYGLQLVYRKLSSRNISRIVGCLNSQDPKVSEAAAKCLIKAKGSLSSAHLVKLVDLLENRDKNVAYNALAVLAEIPQRVPEEALAKIIRILEHQEILKDPGIVRHYIPSLVAKFANKFGPRHMEKLAIYVKKGTAPLKKAAIRTLTEMHEFVSTESFTEIIECLQDRHRPVKCEACRFLEKVSPRLMREHVERIVKIYERKPVNSVYKRMICNLPVKFLAEYIDLFIELLNHQKIETQREILDILTYLAGRIKADQIKHLEKMLYSPECHLRFRVYNFLKTTYALSGLPS